MRSLSIIQQRLDDYQVQNVQEEEQALREMTQEVILAGLSRTAFFNTAVFQGGTALRIFHGLNRFSENLDFTLKEPNPVYKLEDFVCSIRDELQAYGFQLEIQDKSRVNSAVQKVFIKDDSIGKVLTLSHMKGDRSSRKIRVKVEVDTNPPDGVSVEVKYLKFPFAASVTLCDLPSLFAGKIHAILCREYPKGRDWYDLIWYAARKAVFNPEYLRAALVQTGPWQGQAMTVTGEWCWTELKNKVECLDVEAARDEVSRFVRVYEQPSLAVWSRDFFHDMIDGLKNEWKNREK